MISESYLHYYNHQFNLNYTVLRYANVYGPRQVSHGEAGVVSIFSENILSKKCSTIYTFDN
jgi:UDP-glucose 4-epimerase